MARLDSVAYDARNGINAIRHSSALQKLTRVGFACKGLVYFLIGLLALMAALGNGGETTDQRGVLRHIAQQPFGEFTLVVVGIGLIAYAIWRFCSAIFDTEDAGSDAKGLAKRGGFFIAGLVYAGIAVLALQKVFGDGGAAGGTEPASLSARVLQAPGGMYLLMAVGLAIVVAGFMQVRHGLKQHFMRQMRTREMSDRERKAVVRAGKWGYAARGFVFGVVGIFVVIASWRHDPGQVRGLDGALDALASQPFGQLLLAAVALGFIGSGIYAGFEARYRTVRH